MDPIKVSFMKFAGSVRIEGRETIFYAGSATPHLSAEYSPDLGIITVKNTRKSVEVIIPIANILSFEIQHDDQPEQGDSNKGPQRKNQGSKAS